MIKTENIIVDGKQLIRTYSDAGFYIERDGVIYNEAVDPLNTSRTYEESDIYIEDDSITIEDDSITI